MSQLDFTKLKEFDHHKLVVKIENSATGLKGFIAIHNDNLGSPAVGGTRMFPYMSEKDALMDVLKLSRAMTYKCAMARVPYGGAKGVIIGDPKKDKNKNLLRAYAKAVDSLGGKFYTGEDVGMTQDDINVLLTYSHYFNGRPELAGDPSPYAALSTFFAMQSVVEYLYKKKSFNYIKVAIKGIGKVGKELVRLLYLDNAEVYASDIDSASLNEVKREFPKVKITDNNKIHALPVDIYSPCALGDEFSMKNAAEVKAKIICGAANNQLADNEIGDWFFNHGITYVPDYVANAGGLINVVDELSNDGYRKDRVQKKIREVKHTVEKILTLSFKDNKSPHIIADQIAESYFNKAIY